MPEPTPEEAAATAAAAAEQAAATEKAAADKATADAAAAATLGDAGKAALDAERTARKTAEKAAKDAQRKLDDIEAASLSETERLKKEAEQGLAAAAMATDKLRKANLISAIADKGIAGARGKAAARLLDNIEYGDDDEPTNLDAAITAATAAYGDDLFKGVTPVVPIVNSGTGTGSLKGPELTESELRAAKSFGMDAAEYQAYKQPGYRPPLAPK